MKTLKILVALVLLIASVHAVKAQTTRKEKRAAKEAEVKSMIDAKNYTFIAQSVNPLRGGSINLTSEYDLKITPDTLTSYLPFYGVAYMAPMDPTQGGIKFTSTKFDYKETILKNGGHSIYLKPNDAKDVQHMYLTISTDGYATLSITNSNRDPISFYGYIEGNKKGI